MGRGTLPDVRDGSEDPIGSSEQVLRNVRNGWGGFSGVRD